MGLQRTTPPSVEPLTLAQAKIHLREDLVDTDNDAYITSLIEVARLAAELRTGRTMLTSTWTLTLDAFPDAIRLPRPNALSVASVQYVDANGATQTLNPSDYKVDVLSEPGYIVPAFGKAWPETRDEINAVTVTYTAGYGAAASAVPAPIVQWIKLALTDMYENRARSAGARYAVVPQEFSDSLLVPYKVWESM